MFNAQSLLSTLLGGAQDMARRGEDAAAGAMGVGEDPASREQFRKGALGGAAGAGALALILGTDTGRDLAKTGVAVGGAALLGKLAYDAYQKYQADAAPAGAAPAPAPASIPAPTPETGGLAPAPAGAEDAKARALLTAMVAAAKSDGHVDQAELAAIQDKLAPLGADAQTFLIGELAAPLDPARVAATAPDSATAREMVALTAALIDPNDPPEALWLEQLADALGVAPALRVQIQKGVAQGAV
ncbi:MAG: DUF533 domain-containing protein [Pseudomonadota bacterium]